MWTLRHADESRLGATDGRDLAVLAMAQYKLDQRAEALKTLDRARPTRELTTEHGKLFTEAEELVR